MPYSKFFILPIMLLAAGCSRSEPAPETSDASAKEELKDPNNEIWDIGGLSDEQKRQTTAWVIDPDEIVPADDPRWRAVPLLDLPRSGGCTGSLVGKDTLLTAAHCVDFGNESVPARVKEVLIRKNDLFHVFECTMAPDYLNNLPNTADNFRSHYDVALCKALLPDRPMHPTGSLVYESVDITTPRTSATEITIAGFGCTYEVNEQTGVQELIIDSSLRVGTAVIGDEINREPERFSRDGHFRTRSDRDDDLADACQGDSGGPVFNNNPSIIAVVSGAGVTPSGQHLSKYADLSHPENVAFMRSWLASNPDNRICGIKPALGSLRYLQQGCRPQ